MAANNPVVADAARGVVVGFGVIVALIVVKAVIVRVRERKIVDPDRPSVFGLVAFTLFAFYGIGDMATRFGDPLTWRLAVIYCAILSSIAGARHLFTFRLLSWRERRAEKKEERHGAG